jgi:hypothetical protein
MRAYENLMKNLPKELRGKINSRLEITLTKWKKRRKQFLH